MKLEQLYYFREAVKHSSISIAAEKNFVSQPTLSNAVNKLERELGAELLRRNSKGVVPTQLGETILDKANLIFATVDEIFDLASEQGKQGVVNISTIPCLCDRIIPKVLKQLKQQQLPVMLSVLTSESDQIAHHVSSGISSVGVVLYCDDIQENTDLQYTPLFHDEYLLYIGPYSAYWERESLTLEEAMSQPYIAWREEFQKKQGWTRMLSANGKQPNIAFRTDDIGTLKRMIAMDNYVAFFPRFMSRDDIYLQSGLVKAIPLSDAKLDLEIGYVESKKYKLNGIDKLFLQILQETIKEENIGR